MAHGLALFRMTRTALLRGTLAVCAVVICLASASGQAQQETVRLRLAWGGGTLTQWVGKISLSEGSLSQLQLTGTEIDAPGSMWIEDGAVRIASPRPRRVDGFDVTATAPLSAILRIELAGDEATAARTIEIPLDKLWREYERLPIDEQGNVVLVHRAAADYLRIITDRKQLIFDSNEEFAFDLAMAIPGVEPGTSLDLKVDVIPGRIGQSTWSDQRRVPVPVDQGLRVPLAVPLPVEEGVYTIRIRVAKPAGFHERWVPGVESKTVAERKFQVVVFEANKKLASRTEEWRTLLEIDPANPAWWKRLPDWVWLPAARLMPKGPLGSAPAKVINHPQGMFVELATRKKDQSAEWHAYPLPIGRPGAPHLIEVEYPSDLPQSLGLSLVEPNATGRVLPPGQGGGQILDEWSVRSDGVVRKVQYVCWPKTASPWLVIRNPSREEVARFGKIRVRAAGNRLPAPANAKVRESKRLIAAYIARPYLAESFDASDAAAANGQGVNDWQSYYEATTRLVDYLKYAGYNATVINVAAEGSAIYPSKVLQRTPRHDRSWLDEGTVDLPPIDPLELLLRVCDREGVAVLPALRIDTPLPELEALRRSDPLLDVSLVCRDFRGQGWHQRYSFGTPVGVRYNLLNTRVQESIASVIQEVVDQYQHHKSLAGVGIQLAGGTSSILPGPQWTTDKECVKAYLKASQAPWPANYDLADSVGRFRGLAEQDAPFRAWRAKRISRFYGDVAAYLQATDSSRRLVLLTEEMFDDLERSPRIRPRLNGSVGWKELFREAGIDFDSLAGDRGIVLLRPSYFKDGRQLPDAAHDDRINSSVELNELTSNGAFGGLLQFQRPSLDRLTSFENASPFGADRTNLTITSPPLSTNVEVLERLAFRLAGAEMVVIGGVTLPRGGEERQRPLLEMLKALPVSAAENEGWTASEHGVQVRIVPEAEETVCLVANRSPWPVEVAVTLDFPQGGRMTPLSGVAIDVPGEFYTQGQHVWTLTVGPFDVVAMRCSVPQVKVVGLRTKSDTKVKSRLAAKLQDLRQRNLSDQRTYSLLVNSSFERSSTTAGVEGWSIQTAQGSGTSALDSTSPRGGETSLHLASDGGTVSATSNPFANPGTGQLAMTTYVRTRGVDPKTELRIVFQSDRTGYRQYTIIKGEQLATATEEFDWRYLAFGVDDLPLGSQDQIQVRFEFNGPGEVWIDEVVLFDLLFSHNFYAESDQQKLAILRKIHTAEAALVDDRLYDCWRLINDYWLLFAQEHLPLVETPTAVARGGANSDRLNAPKPPQTPSLGERMKQYVPGFLR